MGMVETQDKVKPAAATPETSSPLSADRVKVYPKAVSGTVRRAKWVILALCLGLYYLVPWLRWERGPGLPDQAVLVDIEHARLYFFMVEIWPKNGLRSARSW